MHNRRVTFLLVIMIVLLAGNGVIQYFEYQQRKTLPPVERVSLYISGLDSRVSGYIRNTIRFPGFLRRGEQKLAILNQDIVFTGETVTVKVLDIEYRLLVKDISEEAISLVYLGPDEVPETETPSQGPAADPSSPK